MYSVLKKILIIILIVVVVLGLMKACSNKKQDGQDNDVKENDEVQSNAKPLIYLYPEEEQEISVRLIYDGQLTCTYPEYKEGWNVIAKPDGTLINLEDNMEYSYLFWEGITQRGFWDLSRGFVVKGDDTKDFLQYTLSEMGLTPKEYNEFIVYWLPHMQDNEYNLIHFSGDKYKDLAQLKITPKPDSILRVYMVFKPLNEYIEVQEQIFPKFEREGFTVVEWGGTELE